MGKPTCNTFIALLLVQLHILAVHGTAPDIAGKGMANPTALMQSAVLMLAHIGEREASGAASRRRSSKFTRTPAHLTGDIGGKASTTEFTERGNYGDGVALAPPGCGISHRACFIMVEADDTLLSSSMVEHSAVNRRVVGSSPT